MTFVNGNWVNQLTFDTVSGTKKSNDSRLCRLDFIAEIVLSTPSTHGSFGIQSLVQEPWDIQIPLCRDERVRQVIRLDNFLSSYPL